MPERYDTTKSPNYWAWGLALLVIALVLWVIAMVVWKERQPDIDVPTLSGAAATMPPDTPIPYNDTIVVGPAVPVAAAIGSTTVTAPATPAQGDSTPQ